MGEDTLKTLIKKYTLHGDFILSSFQSSKWYVDIKSAILSSKVFIDEVIDAIEKRKILDDIQAIGCLSWCPSSVMLASCICRESSKSLPLTIVEFPYKAPMPTQLEETNIQGYLPQPSENVLIVSDIAVTGFSLLKGWQILLKTKCNPKCFVIINRCEDKYLKEFENKGTNILSFINWNEFKEFKECLTINDEIINNQRKKIKEIYPMIKPIITDIHKKKDTTLEGELIGMKRAIEQAKKCKSEDTRVHPKVGAIIIKDNKIICESYRNEFGYGEHAEYIALERKCIDENLAGTTLITTLEPCTNRNKPKIACTNRIIERNIKKVIIGNLDPYWKVHGKGELQLLERAVDVEHFPADLGKIVWELNKDFRKSLKSLKTEYTEITPIDISNKRKKSVNLQIIISEKMSEEEFKNLCFAIDIDYEELAGKNKSGKIRELLIEMERKEKTDLLQYYLKDKYPEIFKDL